MHNTKDASDDEQKLGGIFYPTFDSAFLTIEDGHAMSDWILDSGASLHLSPHKKSFTTYVANERFCLGNDM